MNTYEFCASWVARQAAAGARVLDYGCGAGQLVGLLRDRGCDASGCDVFYEGGDYSVDIPQPLRPHIVRMDGDRIPFPDGTFDFVISNQVMEHVPNLDTVVREIARVLKPGGQALNLFPDRGIWREGHCGVPFLHRFPKRSTPRIYYAAIFRACGFGLHKGSKTVMQWASEFCTWLDAWTYYRPLSEIHQIFAKHFGSTDHREELWFDARFSGRGSFLPRQLRQLIVRKFAGLALVSVRR